MTISTQSSQVILLGNGATTAFNFPFVGAAASDIQVTYIDANNNSTVLSPSQYTLVLNPASPGQLWGVGGTVTYPTSGSPIANGTFLAISRIVPFTQIVTISNQGDFTPQVIEQAMDLLEMQIQQVAARTGRYRGIWSTGLVYYGGDVVVDGANGTNTGNFYMCGLQNTSGTWSTDLAAGDWVLAYIGLTAANITAVLGYTPMRGSNNLSEITNAATARGVLGLGSMSTQSASAVAITGGTITGTTITGHASLDLAIANNLSDLANSATARTNLGLGTMAVQNANSVAITGGTGSGLSFWGIGVAPSYILDVFLADASTDFNTLSTAAQIKNSLSNNLSVRNVCVLNVKGSVDNDNIFATTFTGVNVTMDTTVSSYASSTWGVKSSIISTSGASMSFNNSKLVNFYSSVTIPDSSSVGSNGLHFYAETAGAPNNGSYGSLTLVGIAGFTLGNNGSMNNYQGLRVGSFTAGTNCSFINMSGILIDAPGALDASSSATNVYGLQIGDMSGLTTGNNIYAINYASSKFYVDLNGYMKHVGMTLVSTQFDTTSGTLANVTGLTATIALNKKYKFRAVLHVTANATGGHKYAIGGTAVVGSSGNIIYQVDSERNDTSATVITSRQTALAGSVGAAGGTTIYTVIEGEIVLGGTGATAGTVTVQFAQNTASGTSSVLVGSTFVVDIMS